jgi:hypothetical protein
MANDVVNMVNVSKEGEINDLICPLAYSSS